MLKFPPLDISRLDIRTLWTAHSLAPAIDCVILSAEVSALVHHSQLKIKGPQSKPSQLKGRNASHPSLSSALDAPVDPASVSCSSNPVEANGKDSSLATGREFSADPRCVPFSPFSPDSEAAKLGRRSPLDSPLFPAQRESEVES